MISPRDQSSNRLAWRASQRRTSRFKPRPMKSNLLFGAMALAWRTCSLSLLRMQILRSPNSNRPTVQPLQFQRSFPLLARPKTQDFWNTHQLICQEIGNSSVSQQSIECVHIMNKDWHMRDTWSACCHWVLPIPHLLPVVHHALLS